MQIGIVQIHAVTIPLTILHLTAFALTRENSENINTATHHIYKLGASVSGYISDIDYENHKLNIVTLKKKEQ